METTKIDSAEQQASETIFTEDDFAAGIYDKHIRQARNAIFFAAGILLINVLVLAGSAPAGYEYLALDIGFWSLFIAGFIALGFWTKKKPYYAIVGALILYGLFILINAVISIDTIFQGIIFKIIIIVLLVKGINDARTTQQMRSLYK